MALLSSALPLGVKPRDGLQAIALGLLSFLAFPPIGWGPISLIILCRMLTFLRDQPTAVARNLGVLFGLGFAASTMYWLINVFGISAIALMGLMAAYFGLLGTFIGMTREYRPALRAALVAVFIVGIEWLRGDAWYLRFPWYTVPHALADSPRWIAGAHWLGSYGLSLVIWFVAGLGAYCWKPFWVILLLLPACAWLLPDVGTTDRKALLIQTEGQFISTEMLDKIPKEHVDLTVLPEYTYYTSPASALRSSHGPTTLARRMSSPVVFGAVEGEYGTPKFDNLA
ncbi:MAG: hypothetical protein K8T89_16775, partial [Planctomycetes bacterium]|nr:hypothetical protein [Planctomycetota bacterium]